MFHLVPHCQVLKHFVQDYLTAKDDKEHERELLAEVNVFIITAIVANNITINITIDLTINVTINITIKITNDITIKVPVNVTIVSIVIKVIWALDAEYEWWEGRMEEVEVGGTKHKLARLVLVVLNITAV